MNILQNNIKYMYITLMPHILNKSKYQREKNIKYIIDIKYSKYLNYKIYQNNQIY